MLRAMRNVKWAWTMPYAPIGIFRLNRSAGCPLALPFLISPLSMFRQMSLDYFDSFYCTVRMAGTLYTGYAPVRQSRQPL